MKVELIDIDDITPGELVRSLHSVLCPSCERRKAQGHSLCRKCYGKLTAPAKRALYDSVGDGYEEAMREAAVQLHVGPWSLPWKAGAK